MNCYVRLLLLSEKCREARLSSIEPKLQGEVLLNNGDLSFEYGCEAVRRENEENLHSESDGEF